MKRFILSGSVMILVLFFLSPLTALAIGQMTQPIVIADALRGSEYTEKLTILNSAKGEMPFGLKAEGQIAEWASFYEITDTKLEKPVTEIKVAAEKYQDATVKFTIPDSAANGEYRGSIAVIYTPPDTVSAATSTALTQSVSRQVTISVSDKENIKFDISVIPEKYDLAPDEALKIRLIYDNQSNIVIKPQADLKIVNAEDRSRSVYNAIFPFPESEAAVKPGTQQEIPSLTVPSNGWQTGTYLATFNFSQGGESVEKQFNFSLRPENAVSAAQAGVFSGYYRYIWILVIILVLVSAYFVKKHNDTKSGTS